MQPIITLLKAKPPEMISPLSTAETAPMRLCIGEVAHTRLRPAKNAFRYGVYFLRVSVRAMATSAALTQSRWFSHNRFNLLSFFDKDHGDGQQPLSDWIDQLLEKEGIHDAKGDIWLQCFPRVFGYVFNPVSFWFCHRMDGSLRAIVCEVCNTFGEKHMYLLEHGQTMTNGEELRAKKIFHVSPFCPVEGGYRFRFSEKMRASDGSTRPHHVARIDYDDAAGPLLLTSIIGTEVPLTNKNIVSLMFRYPLMTLGVVVKIHVQALRLFIKRVPFFSKPLPPAKEVSR